MSDIIVAYHAPCTDGFVSAWVLRQVFRDAEFIGINHGESPPNVTGKHVVMADFTFPREIMEDMLHKCTSMRVYDHHQSAQESLAGLDEHPKMVDFVFDMDRSGAGIVWDEYGDQITDIYDVDENGRPWIINYVEDQDLWRFKYPDTKAFNEGLRANMDTMQQIATTGRTATVYAGQAILKAKTVMVQQSVAFAQRVNLLGEQIWVSNVGFYLSSETAHELIRDNRVGVTWYQEADGRYKVSFRSNDGASALEFANKCGELPETVSFGGHPDAAGITTTRLPWERHPKR